MNLAIIESGGKQYLVSPETTIQVEKIVGNVGDTIKFDKVLFSAADKNIKLGKPFVDGITVEAEILKQGRSKKLLVFKYKAKSKYRRKQGHRQAYTEVLVKKI